MPRGIFALVITAIIWAAPVAHGATFSTATAKDGKVTVSLTGEITEGDSDALKTNIRTANSAGHLVALVRLNSPGGSILESVKLADIIRFGKISTLLLVAQYALPLASLCLLREARNM